MEVRHKSQRTEVKLDYLDAHVNRDEEWDGEGDGARRLRHRLDGVNKRVEDAAGGERAEQVGGQRCRRIRGHVQRAQHPEHRDVLQVVEVRAPHSLHVRIVKLQFSPPRSILRIRKHLLRVTLSCCQ